MEARPLKRMTCPGCGGENPVQNRFCTHCGAPLGASEEELAETWEEQYRRLVRDVNELANHYAREASRAEQRLKAVKAEVSEKLQAFEKAVLNPVEEGLAKVKSGGSFHFDPAAWERFGEVLQGFDHYYAQVPSDRRVACPQGHSVPDPAMEYCPECGVRVVKEAEAPPLSGMAKEIVDLEKGILNIESKVKGLEEKLEEKKEYFKSGLSIIMILIFSAGCIIGIIAELLSRMGELYTPIREGTGGHIFLFTLGIIAFIALVYFFSYSGTKSELATCRGELAARRNRRDATAARLEEEIRRRLEQVRSHVRTNAETIIRDAEAQYNQTLRTLEQSVASEIRAWHQRKDQFLRRISTWIRDWSSPQWTQWQPVETPLPALLLGHITHPSLPQCSLPLLIPFRRGKGLLIKAAGAARDEAIRVVQTLGYRLLTAVPPGKLRFTFIDPVGLGQNIAGLINLKDYDASEQDSLVTFRVWSESDHIRRQLEAVKEHISTVIQERLRDKYPDIETYNREAGEVAVPYRIPIVLDFPVNFNEESAKHLVSIAQSGPQVGVFPVVLLDPTQKLPYDFKVETLEGTMPTVEWGGNRWTWKDPDFRPWNVRFDPPPDKSLQERLIREWGQRAPEGMRVEVPFDRILSVEGLTPDTWWRESTRDGLQIPLGPITARKLQYLELGRGTLNHGLIVGRTGSGKSNLLHVLVTAGSLKYPPDELRMYLIDLKTVEFVTYRDLPHAEAVAIDADREFALSVLEGADREMRERMEKFKNVGANDLAEYRDKTGTKLPRILLIIDEFQVLFEEDDRVAQESARLLDRLVRQGRAFGIHVLLGSQSLAGHALPRSTIDQMAVRIALQCSEADSRLVLAEDNPAARWLSRPGQAVYNSRNGLPEGNTEFQVALFSDEDRETYIRKIREKAEQLGVTSTPIVFAGNEPARIEECIPLLDCLETAPAPGLRVVETWLGESVSIRPPVAVRWTRRAGNHLAVVTREEEEGVGLLMATAIGLCVRYPVDRLCLYIADFSTAEAEWAEIPRILQEFFPHGRRGQLRLIGRRELINVLNDWAALIEQAHDGEKPREDRYLFLVGLHRIRDLRLPEAFGFSFGEGSEKPPSAQLATLLRDGPEFGIHVAIWCDTVANLFRSLDRRAVAEIGFRVAGAMSEQDSNQWLDSVEAARLNKPHRMIFYDDERPGVLEKFRPYVVRDANWLKSIGKFLNETRL